MGTFEPNPTPLSRESIEAMARQQAQEQAQPTAGLATMAATKRQLSAVIIRCTCRVPGGNHQGRPCPRGKKVLLGTVSYWHRNPLKRWVWRVKEWVLSHTYSYKQKRMARTVTNGRSPNERR